MVARAKQVITPRTIRTRITRGGQITLPAQVRRALGVGLGDDVDIRLEKDGQVRVIKPKYTLANVKGSVKPATRTEDFEQMIRDAQEDLVDRFLAGR
jgi:AbrB family looped-hinge helix DNA binding protein